MDHFDMHIIGIHALIFFAASFTIVNIGSIFAISSFFVVVDPLFEKIEFRMEIYCA